VRDRGSVAIEFALVLPLVLVVVLAVVEVVTVARVQLEVTHAAREGARQAATHPDVERAIAAVRRSLSDDLAGRARVAVERDAHVGGAARVTVRFRHQIVGSLFGGIPVGLESTAVMRVER